MKLNVQLCYSPGDNGFLCHMIDPMGNIMDKAVGFEPEQFIERSAALDHARRWLWNNTKRVKWSDQ